MRNETINKSQIEILIVAEELLTTLGYSGFSYKDIAERVGIRKASIHYYYPTKADLGVAIVKQFRNRFFTWQKRMAQSKRSSVEKLQDYFQTYANIIQKHDQICMVGVLSAHYPGLPESVQKELKRLMNDQHVFMMQLLNEGIASGEFKNIDNITEVATWIGASLQGALQISRTFKNADLFNGVISQILNAIVK